MLSAQDQVEGQSGIGCFSCGGGTDGADGGGGTLAHSLVNKDGVVVALVDLFSIVVMNSVICLTQEGWA